MSPRYLNIGFGLVFLLAIILLYLPIATVGFYAFFPLNRSTKELGAPSLQYFSSLLGNTSVLEALANTGVAAVLSSTISLLIATVYAAFLRDRSRPVRIFFETLIYAPFFLPPIIVGLSLLLASVATGIPRGIVTVVIGHSLFTLAIVYRIVSVRLANLPENLLHASSDLGASPLQTIRFVILPHLSSAFVASGLLAVLLSFDETLITALVAGDMTTLPLRLWAMMRVGFSPSINALVVVVISICLVFSLGAYAALSRAAQRA